ncbi:FAD binding domain-containing protein [Actinokineospora auranticolor]|uniref:CO/xanthine dehydrogenase FAD-binding subunit n=1 Tax=Actinokineospora auranticolor TaxID=155976 RepID=A0A2S6GK76_9PSEU|nr:FAD binding domain-containing protein [Actinokineospora auranticolor]PPK65590.1 CO/xanthine dehydrogenase FAD-binding subunit [Actinokineospora auranticolor]
MLSRAAPRRVLRPRSVEEAAAVLADLPAAEVLGGGTVALPDWRRRGAPEFAVHLGAVVEPRRLGSRECGALVTLDELTRDARVPTALRQAAASVGGPAVRAMATVGGNVVAVRPGCVAVALLAVGAVGEGRDRGAPGESATFSLDDLFDSTDRLLLSTHWQSTTESAFAKLAVRSAGGPNVVSVAIGRTADTRAIAIGGPGTRPHRVAAAESDWGEGASAADVARAAAVGALVADDVTATARYRRAAVETLVRRLITTIEEGG